MVRDHTDDSSENEQPTTRKETATEQKGDASDEQATSTRRSVLRAVGGASALGIGAALGAGTSRGQSGDVSSMLGGGDIPAGEYSWDGSGLSVGSGDAVVGGGSSGDVVLNLESGTMDGSVEGRLENVVVRGQNQESKSGINIYPGAEINGFCWPEGGNRPEDRVFYHPEGGERAYLRNSAWAGTSDNGAYIDKSPMTIENCVGLNCNVAALRVGHRDGGDVSATTKIRNSLLGATSPVRTDASNGGNQDSQNGIGLRVRHPGNFVVENCWLVYTADHTGADALVELRGDDITIEFRNCHFHNDSDTPLFNNQGSGNEATLTDCTVSGSGPTSVEASGVSGSLTPESADVPLPSEITGIPQADELYGFDPTVAPFSGEATVPDDGGDGGSPAEGDRLAMHASPENSGEVDVFFLVDGEARYGSEAEDESYPGTSDTIESTDAGTEVTSIGLDPDALDSFLLDGPVVDYEITYTASGEPADGATVDVSMNGTTTTWEELVGGDDGSTDDGSSGDDGSTDDGSTDDGSSGDDGSTDDGSTDDGSTDDGSTDDGSTDDGSTDDGSTDDGSSGDDGSTDDGSSDDGSSDDGTSTLSNRLTVNGVPSSVTHYTFTVSGDVERTYGENGSSPWDQMDDIARDGKIIGVVGDGVDVYRFSGSIADLTIDGEAQVNLERDL